jgi:hypothetical protein
LQQRFNGYGFDHLVQPGATLADIDTDALTQFLETANAVRNVNESLLLPADVVLQNSTDDRQRLDQRRPALLAKPRRSFSPAL